MTSNNGNGNKNRLILIETAPHRKQPHRQLTQHLDQTIDLDLNKPILRRQRSRLLAYARAELVGDQRYSNVSCYHRDPTIHNKTVMRDTSIALTQIDLEYAQRYHQTAAKCANNVDRLTHNDAQKTPTNANTKITQPLDDNNKINIQHVPNSQQTNMQRNHLERAAKNLTHNDRPDQPANIDQPNNSPRKRQ